MIIDGKKLAEEIKEKLKACVREHGSGTLAVVLVGDDSVTRRFVRQKELFAHEIGVEISVHAFPETLSEEKLVGVVEHVGGQSDVDGVIVQLPLPKHVDTDALLTAIPPKKDVDALSAKTRFVPPAARAVEAILKYGDVELKDRKAVVVGQGRLVGKPVAAWLKQAGAEVSAADITTKNLTSLTKDADIVVSGAGVPKLIMPDMVKQGVVLIDAGTSESEGKLVGDIDPACAGKASLYTPVPGGVGPVVVAMLFANLLHFDL